MKYGANHFFVQKGFYFVWDDIFHTQHIPLTRELFKDVDKEKLFHYDRVGLVNVIEEKANYLYKLRPFWFYPFALTMCEIIKGNYEAAFEYAKKAEELKPNDDGTFAIMHFANILKASQFKGIEVEELLPTKKELEDMLKNYKKSN